MRKLHKNGLPVKIKTDVEKGLKLTIKEYAKRYNNSEAMIRTSLQSLRKSGCWWIGIIGYKAGIGKKCQAGKIVDLRKEERWFSEDNNRTLGDKISRLSMQFKKLEAAYICFPELRLQIDSGADQLQRKLLDHRVEIRKLNSGKKNENNK